MDMLSIFTFVVFGIISFNVGATYSRLKCNADLCHTNEIMSMLILEMTEYFKVNHKDVDAFTTNFRIKLQTDENFKRYLSRKYKGV
jgi:hypothetical protein